MNAFVASKERVPIPLSGKNCSLQAFVRHVVEHAGLREEKNEDSGDYHQYKTMPLRKRTRW